MSAESFAGPDLIFAINLPADLVHIRVTRYNAQAQHLHSTSPSHCRALLCPSALAFAKRRSYQESIITSENAGTLIKTDCSNYAEFKPKIGYEKGPVNRSITRKLPVDLRT